MRVSIAGAGVIGLCAAYYLQKAGHEVTVIDRGNITDGTSFGNAGYVSPSHFIPLASPGIIAKGLRWMLSSSSPFYIRPRLNRDLLEWGFAFWRSANEKTVSRNMVPLFRILDLSRSLTSSMRDEMGNHFRMEEKGCFMLYRSAATEKHELELAEKAAKLNIETKIYSGAEVQNMEPDVEVKVKGGVLYPIDCHLHPGDFMRTLHQHLQENGVKFQLNTTITGFEKQGDRVFGIVTDKGQIPCDELVLAAGSWMPLLARELGIKIIMQAGKGYSMTFQNPSKNLRYPAILVEDRVAMTPMGKDLRMGGTMEISGLESPMLVKRAQAIFQASRNYYPSLPVSFPGEEKIWSGLRPLSPDGLPYLGRHPKFKNLVFSGGHAMLGLSLAAGSGKLVQEIVDGPETSIDISAFSLTRFSS